MADEANERAASEHAKESDSEDSGKKITVTVKTPKDKEVFEVEETLTVSQVSLRTCSNLTSSSDCTVTVPKLQTSDNSAVVCVQRSFTGP